MTLQQTAKIALSILALMAHAAVSEAAEPPSHTAIVQAAIEKHVIPHIDALKEAAAQLPGAVASMCRTGSAAAKEDLSSRFRNVVKAYAGIDFLRFGPMLEGGRRERLSFWPDPRGFVGRQLRLILLNKDEAVVQPGAIAKQSVAVQGLSALEALMTDKEFPLGPGEASRYRCELAEAIAANIVSVADEISDGWEKPGGWKDKMLHPGADNDTYKSPGKVRRRACQSSAGRAFVDGGFTTQAASQAGREAGAAVSKIGTSKGLLRVERRVSQKSLRRPRS